MKPLPLALLAALMLAGCTDPDGAKRVLEQSGYKQVEITGWRPMAASEDEDFATGFRATAPNGSKITGTVTRGLLFKGNTIRLD